MLKLKYALLINLMIGVSCSSQKNANTVSSDNLEKIIEKKLGSQVTKENNFEGTFVLAWSEEDKSGTPIIRFGVWVVDTGELKYAGTAIRGKVAWLDNTSLLVEDYPGIIDGNNQQFKFKIDVNTKIKTPLHEKEDI